MVTNGISSKLPFKIKLGYGAAEWSSTLTWTMVSVLFLFYLTDIVGLDPAFAGFVLMVGAMWDAVSDPAVGVISDRFKSRWGRRRPFLLGVALPFGLITWLLFTDFGFGALGTKIYFCLGIMAYYTAATLLDVPYTSLGAEMTQDYDERTSLNGFRAVFSQVAAIVAAALPWVMVSFCADIAGSEKAGWSLMAAIFGLCAIFPILITWRSTRGSELHSKGVTIRMRDVMDGPLKNRTFLYTMGLYAAASVGLSSAAAVMVYFMKYYMKFNETQESLAFLFLFACTILWIPVINKLSAKYDKREAYMLFIGLWVVIQAVGTMLLTPSMTIVFYAMMVVASGGVMSISMTIWAMIPDAVEVDELKFGQRREGLFFGVISFVRKLAVAFFIWMIGIVLSKIGYVAGQVQPDGVLLGIRLLYAEGVAFFLLLSMVGAYLLPMTRKRHAALKEAIQQKKEGKEWDAESIKEIL
jgi:GPH family glycoside/pentoside/hexuronide:cation symporter